MSEMIEVDAARMLAEKYTQALEEKLRRLRGIQEALGELAHARRDLPEVERLASTYGVAAALSRLGYAPVAEGAGKVRVGEALFSQLSQRGAVEVVAQGVTTRYEPGEGSHAHLMRPARWWAFIRASLRALGEEP